MFGGRKSLRKCPTFSAINKSKSSIEYKGFFSNTASNRKEQKRYREFSTKTKKSILFRICAYYQNKVNLLEGGNFKLDTD